jgi:hypothetical protein
MATLEFAVETRAAGSVGLVWETPAASKPGS